MSYLSYFLPVYLLFMNLFGFVLMGSDKKRARKHRWRIPEKTLFLTSLLGGSLGTLAGMYFFHHKTRHWYFAAGMPAILALHVTAAVCIRHFL